MKRLIPLFLLCTCCSFNRASDQNSSNQSLIVFKNVNVIPMDTSRILYEQDVLVKNEKIENIGEANSFEIPTNAKIISGSGKFLMPGLTDFHIHLRSTDELVSYLANGVTTVVQLGDGLSGAPDILEYRKKLRSGELLGPTLFSTGPLLDGDPPIRSYVGLALSTPEEAKQAVIDQHKAGYDFIKLYNNLSTEAMEVAITTAHGLGMAVIGHIPRGKDRNVALQSALNAGLDLIAHGEEYFFTYFNQEVDSLLNLGVIPHPDYNKIPEVVQLTKQANTWVMPNLSFVAMTRKQLDDLESIFDDPEVKYLHPDVLSFWQRRHFGNRPDLERFDRREVAKSLFLLQLTKTLNDADVPLILGTDASYVGLFPGKSAHLELFELVRAGLSPYEALQTGTSNPASFINAHVRSAVAFGMIKKGQLANLLLLNANPLDDIQNIESINGVMINGAWMLKEDLEATRKEIVSGY